MSTTNRVVRRILASRATESVPFGAVAHLLPLGARDSDPLALISALQQALTAGTQQRPVLVIDDIPSLDLASAGVIANLVVAGEVDVIASARDDETVPSPMVDVLFGDSATIIELKSLSDDDIDTLLHLVLGGPVDGAALVSFRDRSGGNPLFLRELVRGGLEAGALVEVEGVWRLRGEAPGSARLREVVESRLDVDAALRPAVELLALCDIVELDELESLVGLEALADLEDKGLLRTLSRLGRECATLSHPLHAEAIRMSLPPLRTRLLMRNHVDWIENVTHASAVNDPLQRAIWRLDAGLPADLDSLLKGTRLAAALLDSPSVLRLGGPLFEQRPTGEIAWLVVDALFNTGQWAEAFAVLDRAAPLTVTSRVKVDLGVARANILLWGAGDDAAALRTMDLLRADPAMDADDRARLSAQYASILVNAGLPGEACAELEAATTSHQLQIQLGAAVAYANSLTMGGRTQQAIAALDQALAKRPTENAVMAVADVDTHMVSRVFAHIEAGDLSRALHIAEEGYERAVTTSRPLTQFWFSLLLGRIHLCTGAVATAQRRFASARALGIDSGLSGPVRSALVGSAIAHALLGDATAAEAAQVEIDRMTPFGFMAPERALADGWVAVAKGDLASARRLLADGAKIAADSGHMTSAIWMLHDIARLGGADDVAGQVSALAAATDSTLAHARAVHVTAMVTGRQLEMVAAADQFEAIGAHLLAAEACVAAAEIARTEGDQRSAVALTVRAERNGAKCEGATSPGLLTVAGAVEPLTEREREIAFMAANGMTSREIADRIFVSLRTVSNHLQHVYDKLGVRSRADLRQALDFGQIVTTSNG